MVGVGQPGVKRKQRHLDRKPKKNSGKRDPREISGEQARLPKTRQSGEVERTFGEVNSKERKQHGYASEKCVQEKFGCGAIAVFAAPDFYQQKARNQTHFVKQKPENEILSGERPVERRLHDQDRRVKRAASVWSRLCEQCEWNNQRREQYEQQA